MLDVSSTLADNLLKKNGLEKQDRWTAAGHMHSLRKIRQVSPPETSVGLVTIELIESAVTG